MNIHTNAKIKQFLLNVVLMLALHHQNIVFLPLLPFLAAAQLSAADPDLSSASSTEKGLNALFTACCPDCCWTYSTAARSALHPSLSISYINGILPTTTMKTTLPCASILSVFNKLAYSMYVYVFGF